MAALSTVQLESIIRDAFTRAGADPELGVAIARHESGLNPEAVNMTGGDAARGGSYGALQMSLKTARGLGFNGDAKELLDPHVNAELAARFVSQLSEQYPDKTDVISAYNSGKPLGRAPESTRQTYVPGVLKFLADAPAGDAPPAADAPRPPRVLSAAEAADEGLPPIGETTPKAAPAAAPRVLSAKEAEAEGLPPISGPGMTFAGHAAQSALMGFGDELVGGYKALSRKALPEALGGAPAGIPIGDLYREERDKQRAQMAADAAANPKAALGGRVFGTLVTGAAVPGSWAATLPRAVGTGLVLGGLSGAGESTAEDLGGLAQDTGVGALFGAGGGAAGYGVSKAVGGIAGYLGNKAKDFAAGTLKGTAGEYKNLGQEERRALGEWLLRNRAVRAGDTFENVAERIPGLQKQAGAAKDAALQELDKTSSMDLGDLRQALLDRALQEEQKGPGARGIVDYLLREAAAVEDVAVKTGQPRIPVSGAERWKTMYQDIAYPKGIPSPEPTATQYAQRAVAGEAKDAAERAAAQGSGPAYEKFLQAKKDYGTAATADKLLGGAEGRSFARNFGSPSDKAAAALALVKTQNPAAAVAVGVLNNQVRTRAASTLAKTAQGGSRLMQLAAGKPSSLGKFAAVLVPALNESTESFNAHSYVLGQTDPAFQELQRKLNDEEAPP